MYNIKCQDRVPVASHVIMSVAAGIGCACFLRPAYISFILLQIDFSYLPDIV